jgi:hypothetical protein
LPKGYFSVRIIKDTKVEDGKRFWLCAWAGAQPGPSVKAWPDSWEPTALVTPDLIADFKSEQAERDARSISIDVRALDSLVQRTVSMAMMGCLTDENAAFGLVHITPLPVIALKGLADYVIDEIGARFGVEVMTAYLPGPKLTRKEVCLHAP